MVDTVTLQEGQIFAEFQLLVFSVIFCSCTRTSDGPNWPSTVVIISFFKWIFSLKLGQFVRTAVTRGDLFYIFSGFQPNPELSGDIRLYITLMMKMDKLPVPSAGSKVFGLEVCNSLLLFYERSGGSCHWFGAVPNYGTGFWDEF